MFCAGNINHVGIKTLQLILAKVVLLLGVRIIAPCSLVELIEPDDKGSFFSKVKLSFVILTTFEFSHQKHDARIQENHTFQSTPNPK